MNFRKSMSLAAAVGLCLSMASTASAQNYTFLDLGQVTANALNDLGQVAGVISSESSAQAFYTGANGIGINMLAAMPTVGNSWAFGINNSGQVVGDYSTSSGTHGFVTGAGGQGVTDVVYPNANDTTLTGINASGQTVGRTSNQAITSGPNGAGWQTLNIPSSMLLSTGRAINANGQVLGIASDMSSEMAFTTFITGPNGQGYNQVGSLAGIPLEGAALNNHGDVVGQSYSDTGVFAFFADASDGTVTNLGALGDGTFSQALAINDQGTIVGASTENTSWWGTSAFIIGGKGQDMIKLSTLVIGFEGSFTEAVAINNAGQILVRDGLHSYLLTPTAIPETQTSAMLMLGFLGMAWATGRRVKTAPTAQA